ncbi:DsrE family protein [Thiomicrospira microaerophila]|uniref:DsrE family protein n=1 Tax=Thiomicrospira microaerophila TaxID=406020 RepID=UPI0005C85A33|nr:DsrE family protein [Thiomicrospira microaerophila]
MNSAIQSMSKWFITFWLVLFFMSYAIVQAASLHPDVQRMLAQDRMPSGVVIEVESLSKGAMTDNATFIQAQVDALKQRFPDLDVVIVSHGRELIELAKPKDNQPASTILSTFENMSNRQGVTVHVCAVVAGWEGKTDQDFAGFVDVSASGEAQINDYRALGYEVVIIERLSDEARKSLQPVAE